MSKLEDIEKALQETIQGAEFITLYSQKLWNMIGVMHYKNSDRLCVKIPNASAQSFKVNNQSIHFINSEIELYIEMDYNEMEQLGLELQKSAAKMRSNRNKSLAMAGK